MATQSKLYHAQHSRRSSTAGVIVDIYLKSGCNALLCSTAIAIPERGHTLKSPLPTFTPPLSDAKPAAEGKPPLDHFYATFISSSALCIGQLPAGRPAPGDGHLYHHLWRTFRHAARTCFNFLLSHPREPLGLQSTLACACVHLHFARTHSPCHLARHAPVVLRGRVPTQTFAHAEIPVQNQLNDLKPAQRLLRRMMPVHLRSNCDAASYCSVRMFSP